MKRLSLFLLCAISFAQTHISWTSYTNPGGSAIWPTGQGFASIVPNPGSVAVLVYTTRQATSSSVNTTGTAVTWVSGDQFGLTWGLDTADQITIGGTAYTILQNSVTTTALTLTTSAGTQTGATATTNPSALTQSTALYNWFPSSHTWSNPFAGSQSTITNLSAAFETDSHLLTWPADRQQGGGQTYDSNRHSVWLTDGVSATRIWNSTTHQTTTWQGVLSSNAVTWNGHVPAAFPVNSSGEQSAAMDTTDNCIVQAGYDGGPGFRTSLYCATDLNPTPGTLTANQISAGATGPDTWDTVTTSGTSMPAMTSTFPGLQFSSTANAFYLFNPVLNGNIYKYVLTTKTWSVVGGTCSLPITNLPGSAANYIPAWTVLANGKLLYHYYPATGTASDYLYDPIGDSCTTLINTGGGPSQANDTTGGAMIAYEASTDRIVGWPQTGGSPKVWEGQLDDNVTGQFRIISTWPSGNAKWIEVACLIPSLSAGGTTSITLTGPGGLSVPLPVQEALYGGGSAGVARTDEPMRWGVPIADAAAITSTSGLALTNTTAVSSANMGTDNGSTITVATGTATFTIKKANFNVLDVVDVGSTHVVLTSSSANRGLVVLGPAASGTTCGTCTTVYSSANDANSTASIEENGPVVTVVKATGCHIDNASHPYMCFTAREYFYASKNYVKVTSVLRNANYSTAAVPSSDCNQMAGVCTGGTFNTAVKQFQAYELRLAPNISGTFSYTLPTDTTDQTGTMTTSNTVYTYQGQTNYFLGIGPAGPGCDYLSACANSFTTDTGYIEKKDATTLASGDQTKVVNGWADIRDSGGVGIEIGMEQAGPNFPSSMEFNSGTDVRIGIFSGHNSIAVAQAWPQWSIHELFLNFHATALSSPNNDFLKFQHYLVARPSITYVNSTAVFPWPIVDPTVESNYYAAVAAAAIPAINTNTMCYTASPCIPTPDRVQGASSNLNIGTTRNWPYNQGGQQNQQEWRWNDLILFYERGYTGRLLNSDYFYRFQAEKFQPHSDGTSTSSGLVNGFSWKDRPHVNWSGNPQSNPELDSQGRPSFMCGGDYGPLSSGASCAGILNSTLASPNYDPDGLHSHGHGMTDWYCMSADETIHDALYQYVAVYGNADTVQGSGNLLLSTAGIARYVGIALTNASTYGDYLRATGDSTNANLLFGTLLSNFDGLVKVDACLSGYPAGCTPANTTVDTTPFITGVSKVRGQPVGSRGQGWCPAANPLLAQEYQIAQPFESSIHVEGTLDTARFKGTSWNEYELARDIAYGVGQGQRIEMTVSDGTAHWLGSSAYSQGFIYEIPEAISALCPTSAAGGNATVSGNTVTRVSGPAFASSWATDNGGNGRLFYMDGWRGNVVSVNVGAQTLTLNTNFQNNYASSTHYQTFPTGHATSTGTAMTITEGPVPDSTWIGSRICMIGVAAATVTNVVGSVLTVTPSVGTNASPITYSLNDSSCANAEVLQLANGDVRDNQGLPATNEGTVWMNFLSAYLNNNTTSDWETLFKIALVKAGQGVSNWLPDYGGYQVGALIYYINLASTQALQDVSFTVTDNGSGNYHLNFTLPSGSTAARVKWSPLVIAPSSALLGFNNDTQAFTLSPSTYMTWFGANQVTTDTTICASGCPGSPQSFAVSTGTTGLTIPNFSVKALAPASSPSVSGSTISGYVTLSGKPTIH